MVDSILHWHHQSPILHYDSRLILPLVPLFYSICLSLWKLSRRGGRNAPTTAPVFSCGHGGIRTLFSLNLVFLASRPLSSGNMSEGWQVRNRIAAEWIKTHTPKEAIILSSNAPIFGRYWPIGQYTIMYTCVSILCLRWITWYSRRRPRTLNLTSRATNVDSWSLPGDPKMST